MVEILGKILWEQSSWL